MRIANSLIFTFVLAMAAPSTFGVEKPETPHLVFVTEYIREIASIENIRAEGQQELKQDPNSAFSNMIHTSTLVQLELGSQIRMLRGMRLKAPFGNQLVKQGLPGFHAFRRYFISYRRAQGMPEELLRSMVGHASSDITSLYSRFGTSAAFAAERRSWVEKIGLGFSLPQS